MRSFSDAELGTVLWFLLPTTVVLAIHHIPNPGAAATRSRSPATAAAVADIDSLTRQRRIDQPQALGLRGGVERASADPSGGRDHGSGGRQPPRAEQPAAENVQGPVHPEP